MDKTPVYKYPASYARENNELPLYRASNDANMACKEAIEKAISEHHDGFTFRSQEAVRDVVKQFGYERTLYVLAATVRQKDWDGRISNGNKAWARTVPVFEDHDSFGHDRHAAFTVSSHSCLVDSFVDSARHEYLLSLPLKRDDIKKEALYILSKFQNAQEPNSPNGTHYMAQVSPDFLARAKSKDTDRLMSMLPFQSLSLSTLEGRKGIYALIRKEENRFQPLVLRRPSVKKKLQEKSAVSAAPSAPGKSKTKGQER